MAYTYQQTTDPYNRAPSPGLVMMQQQAQPFSTPAGGQITPGTITYTTTVATDGKVTYHPFRAVAASYQTPQGVVAGIQWVPAEATQILPSGAMPANAEFASAWTRPQDREWQREEEKRRRRGEKDAVRREDKEAARRERERHRRAEENSPSGTGRASPYAMPNPLPRPASPYAPGGGAPYGGGALPGRAPSPYHGAGVLPGRPASPYHGGGVLPGRPVSPYHGGSVLPGQPASPYRGGGALPGRPASPYNRPVSPYHSSNVVKNPSPYHSSTALPSVGRPVSPYRASPALPGQPIYGTGHAASQAEIERRMAEVGLGPERRRKMSTGSGYAVAPGGHYPNTGHSTAAGGYSAANVTGAYSYTDPNRVNVYPDNRPHSRAASPSPYGVSTAIGGFNEQGMLLPPEAFSRPPNAAQSYPRFAIMKIHDMEDFVDQIPKMPLVLVPHDVYQPDWVRLMTDIASAWQGRLPIPESALAGNRVPRRSTVVADIVNLWNTNFFLLRGVELILYKGHERRTGPLAGQVDKHLPGFDTHYGEESSASELSDNSDSELDDPYVAASGRYAHSQVSELREVRKRRKEMEESEKRKKKDKKERKRIRELEKRYSLYLTCVDQAGYRA